MTDSLHGLRRLEAAVTRIPHAWPRLSSPEVAEAKMHHIAIQSRRLNTEINLYHSLTYATH